jgi:hypothetical protein
MRMHWRIRHGPALCSVLPAECRDTPLRTFGVEGCCCCAALEGIALAGALPAPEPGLRVDLLLPLLPPWWPLVPLPLLPALLGRRDEAPAVEASGAGAGEARAAASSASALRRCSFSSCSSSSSQCSSQASAGQ